MLDSNRDGTWTYAAFETPGQVAEVLAPTSVSGCIPGGGTSIETQYRDSRGETRSRTISSKAVGDLEQTFGDTFGETYDFSETPQFLATEARAVPLGYLSELGAAETTTDMFSSASTLSRREDLAWNRDSASGTTGVFTDHGVRSVQTQMLTRYEDSTATELDPLTFEFGTDEFTGGPQGAAAVFGTLESRITFDATAIPDGSTFGISETCPPETNLPAPECRIDPCVSP